jgi:hypothetical protein
MKTNEERRMKSEERGRERDERETAGETGPVSVTTCTMAPASSPTALSHRPQILSEWDDLKIE